MTRAASSSTTAVTSLASRCGQPPKRCPPNRQAIPPLAQTLMTTDHRPAGSHLWTKACVLFLALIICALCAALTSGPAQATNTYGEYSYASFYEHTAPYGVTATWTDEEWSIPCPAETNHEDFVATYVNGYSSVANSWIQTGHGKITFWSGGVCYYQHQYYWEWNDLGHGDN